MAKNKLKLQFFQSEIDYILQFKQSLQQLNGFLKKALNLQNPAQQNAIALRTNEHLKQQISLLRQSMQQTRKMSDLCYDQAKIQEQMLFRSLDEKVQEMGQRLYVAETQVQKGEIVKKACEGAQYEMSNSKTFRKESQTNVIQRHMIAEWRVVREFMRSVSLMIKVNDRCKQYNQNSMADKSQMIKLLKMRQKKISYNQLRRSQQLNKPKHKSHQKQAIDINSQAQSHSLGQIRSQLEPYLPAVPSRPSAQPLLTLLLRSQSVPFKPQCKQALNTLIRRLRDNNKKQTIISKRLEKGLQLRNRDQVLKYLEERSDLNQDESVMKIELMSQKLMSTINERMLSLKIIDKKVSKEYNQGDKYHKNNTRQVKSLQKLNNCKPCSQKSSKKHKKKLTVTLQMQQKPFASNPKTNDSAGQMA